jgi:hypothetical protein
MFDVSGGGDDDVNDIGGGGGGGMNFGRLLNSQKKARDVELPFTPSLKRVLNHAGRLADKYTYESDTNTGGGAVIHAEHVMLSLLEWEVELDDVASAKLDDDGYAKGALAVFLQMDGMAPDFSPTEFCKDLVRNMLEQDGSGDSDGAELVSGGNVGKSSGTPTLSDCGVDLTEAAMQSELDPVFGRDSEIMSTLRTLVRRRKNNPCLVGEPGVGKTAIAEGLAQILAAPTMMERAEELFDRNDDGDWVDPAKKHMETQALEVVTLMGGCVGGGEPVPMQEFVDNDGWPFANFSRTKRLVKFLEVEISVK